MADFPKYVAFVLIGCFKFARYCGKYTVVIILGTVNYEHIQYAPLDVWCIAACVVKEGVSKVNVDDSFYWVCDENTYLRK